MDSRHENALAAAISDAKADAEIIGLLVCGSVARGDALPGSDLDLRFLLSDSAAPRPFLSEYREGVFVERTFLNTDKARERLDTRPMEVYPYCEGRILYDPHTAMRNLCRHAKQIYEDYDAPATEKAEMRYWLESANRKIRAAVAEADSERAGFVSTTTTWPLLTGLFLAANRPLPPSGAVRANLTDACRRANDLPVALVRQLWNAPRAENSAQTACAVIEHLLPLLR